MEHKQLALITGVGKASGIGYEVARQLSELDYKVIITARKLETAQTLAAQLQQEGIDAVPMALDISNEENVIAAAALVNQEYGKLDVLINNATLFPDRYDTLTVDLGDVKAVFDNNFIGYWSCIKYFTPVLRKSSHPRIVNVTSAVGSYGDPNYGLHHPFGGVVNVYGISKLATNGLTLKAAIDLAPDHILVNSVDPDFTASYESFAEYGARPVKVSAKSIVHTATLPKDGPTGKFFRDGVEIPW
jgi:NAD(P)-dependent dehydrogenase (short-subunit alcohol dehydrogenase family)